MIIKDYCKPGQRADLTGCSPRSGLPSAKKPVAPKNQLRGGGAAGGGKLGDQILDAMGISPQQAKTDPRLNPWKETIAGKVTIAIQDLKAKAINLAKKLGKRAYDRLTPQEQKLVNLAIAAEHALASLPKKAQKLAGEIARQRGLSETKVKEIEIAARASDLLAGWTVNIPFTHDLISHSPAGHALGEVGTFLTAKVGYYLPIGSLLYILSQAALATVQGDPLATLRAAKQVLGKAKPAKQVKEHKVMSEKLVNAFEKHSQDPDGGAWFSALYYAALDEMRDMDQAIALAETAYGENQSPSRTETKSIHLEGFLYQTKEIRSLEGKPCEQGQSASRTGCIPADKTTTKPRTQVTVSAQDINKAIPVLAQIKNGMGNKELTALAKANGIAVTSLQAAIKHALKKGWLKVINRNGLPIIQLLNRLPQKDNHAH